MGSPRRIGGRKAKEKPRPTITNKEAFPSSPRQPVPLFDNGCHGGCFSLHNSVNMSRRPGEWHFFRPPSPPSMRERKRANFLTCGGARRTHATGGTNRVEDGLGAPLKPHLTDADASTEKHWTHAARHNVVWITFSSELRTRFTLVPAAGCGLTLILSEGNGVDKHKYKHMTHNPCYFHLEWNITTPPGEELF